MSEDEKSPRGDEEELVSEFNDLNESVLAGLDFSSMLEEAVRPLQDIPFDAILQQQMAPILAAQKTLSQQLLVDWEREFQANLQPLIESQTLQVQQSITPVLIASIAPVIQEIKIQSMLPALQAVEQMQMPAIRAAIALDEIQTVDYAVSEFAAASTTVNQPADNVSQPKTPDPEGGYPVTDREDSTVEWTTSNWLQIYYSLSAILLDEAIDSSGVRDLSEKQRVGICLTVAIMIYATSSQHGFIESVTPAGFLYAILQDFAEK